MQCNMRKAKNKLSALVKAALAGEDVVITNEGVPAIRLVKVLAPDVARKPGAWSALPKARANWDSPATNEAILGLGSDEVIAG